MEDDLVGRLEETSREFSSDFPQTLEANAFVREYELENDRGSIYFVQKQEGDVNCVVWDAALILAKYLEKEFSKDEKFLAGKKVIELGSGLGCVGLVASLCGAHVTMTDLDRAVNLLKLNLKKNRKLIESGRGSAKVEILDWTQDVKMKPCDVILASDCIYYRESISAFVKVLNQLSTSSTEIYLTQELRSHSEIQTRIWKDFVAEAGEHFDFKMVPLTEQHEIFRSPDIYLLRLKKKSN